MEIYTGRVNKVRFYKPTDDTMVTGTTYSFNGSTAAPLIVSSDTSAYFERSLPYLQTEGELTVTWTFSIPGSGSFTENQVYQVVTPILQRHEIKAIYEDATDEQADELEKAVRNIIQSYCGQSFGLQIKTVTIGGSGMTHLALPERLLELTNVDGYRFGGGLYIAANGWYLSSVDPKPFVPPIRADYDEVNSNSHLEKPIRVPNYMRNSGNIFYYNQPYQITGTWGWRYVPAEVREAAKLLVNDYACGDNLYRDRFLTSMTAADWRIQFHDGAFEGTGNVRADQLLNGYVLSRGWAVI